VKKNGLLDDEKTALTKNTSLSAFVMQSLRDRRQRQNAAPVTKDHSFPVIASYNVHKCVGRDRRFDPDRTSRVIQEIGADIIALRHAVAARPPPAPECGAGDERPFLSGHRLLQCT
jgi:hypothetical protein